MIQFMNSNKPTTLLHKEKEGYMAPLEMLQRNPLLLPPINIHIFLTHHSTAPTHDQRYSTLQVHPTKLKPWRSITMKQPKKDIHRITSPSSNQSKSSFQRMRLIQPIPIRRYWFPCHPSTPRPTKPTLSPREKDSRNFTILQRPPQPKLYRNQFKNIYIFFVISRRGKKKNYFQPQRIPSSFLKPTSFWPLVNYSTQQKQPVLRKKGFTELHHPSRTTNL